MFLNNSCYVAKSTSDRMQNTSKPTEEQQIPTSAKHGKCISALGLLTDVNIYLFLILSKNIEKCWGAGILI